MLTVDLQNWLHKLIDFQGIIIVEGKNDKRALQHFGVENIITLENKALYMVVEEVARKSKDCVILTDLDSEGKKLFGNLHSNLCRLGVRCHNWFRNQLFKSKLRHIEGLVSYVTKT